MIKKILATIVSLIVIIGAGYKAWEMKADAKELLLVQERLDKKILRDDKREIKQDIRDIEKEYGENCERCEPVLKDKYLDLKDELQDVEQELKQYKGD